MAKEKTGKKAKKERKIRRFIIAAIVLAIIIAGAYLMLKDANSSRFEYRGIKFRINSADVNRTLYETNFDINRMINGSSTKVITTFVFRKDPRELHGFFEKAVYLLGLSQPENITFLRDNKVYISYEDPIPACEDNIYAAYGLGQFLTLYGLNIKGATANEMTVREGAPFADCGNSTNNTVILVGEGDYTGFKKLSENCYEIAFKKCEILKAAEKFQLAVLENDFGRK